MQEERNQSQIIRKDAKNCFVEGNDTGAKVLFYRLGCILP